MDMPIDTTLDEINAEDLCIRNDSIYVHSGQLGSALDEGIVSAFSLQGRAHHTFGTRYRSTNAMVRRDLSRGVMDCNRHGLVFAYTHLAVIHGYHPTDGTLRWESRLADFQPFKIVEDTRARSILYNPPGDAPIDVIETITMVGDLPYLLLQVLRITSRSHTQGREYAEMFSYVLDSRTGEGAYVGTELPPVYAIGNGRIYAAVKDPFPQIRVYEIPATVSINELHTD